METAVYECEKILLTDVCSIREWLLEPSVGPFVPFAFHLTSLSLLPAISLIV